MRRALRGVVAARMVEGRGRVVQMNGGERPRGLRAAQAVLERALRAGEAPAAAARTTWAPAALRRSYDVVVVGGGLEAVALAWFLAVRHEAPNVAVLHDGPVGLDRPAGARAVAHTARRHPVLARLGARAAALVGELAEGHGVAAARATALDEVMLALDLDHLAELTEAQAAAHQTGGRVELLERGDVARVAWRAGGEGAALAALVERSIPAPLARELAIELAAQAVAAGAHIHEDVAVLRLEATAGASPVVETTGGAVAATMVVDASAWSPLTEALGLATVLTPQREQALVAAAPVGLLSGAVAECGPVRVEQHERYLVVSAALDRWPNAYRAPDPAAAKALAASAVGVVPDAAGLPAVGMWSGVAEVSADGLPLLGPVLPGVCVSRGWGSERADLALGAAEALAALLTGGRLGSALAELDPGRFRTDRAGAPATAADPQRPDDQQANASKVEAAP